MPRLRQSQLRASKIYLRGPNASFRRARVRKVGANAETSAVNASFPRPKNCFGAANSSFSGVKIKKVGPTVKKALAKDKNVGPKVKKARVKVKKVRVKRKNVAVNVSLRWEKSASDEPTLSRLSAGARAGDR